MCKTIICAQWLTEGASFGDKPAFNMAGQNKSNQKPSHFLILHCSVYFWTAETSCESLVGIKSAQPNCVLLVLSMSSVSQVLSSLKEYKRACLDHSKSGHSASRLVWGKLLKGWLEFTFPALQQHDFAVKVGVYNFYTKKSHIFPLQLCGKSNKKDLCSVSVAKVLSGLVWAVICFDMCYYVLIIT